MTDREKKRILVVDDEESLRFFLTKTLERSGYIAEAATNGREAFEILTECDSGFDCVLLDLKMPEMDGMSLLEKLRDAQGERSVPAIIMMTAYGDIRTAVQAVKLGATDFITKPFEGGDALTMIEKAIRTRSLEAENARLRDLLFERDSFGAIAGKSPAMQRLFALVEKIARIASPVLITGESGTGKELVAREIHNRSNGPDAPFVAVNASAIPETLLESELFGHEKGAFTGATSQREGLIRLSSGGTLFLDEIGDMPLALQPKLLRAIQEKEVTPVGGDKPIKVDFRLVSATHQDLANLIREGRFREDLYYRINVLPVRLPSLRERKEDIPVIVEFLLKKFAAKTGTKPPRITGRAMNELMAMEFPGNVRELENLIERFVVFGGDVIESVAAISEVVAESSGVASGEAKTKLSGPLLPYREASREFEKEYLERLLDETSGNVTRAAEIAEVSRPNFHRRLKEIGIDPDAFRK
ncbi:MAG: sigma-54 dependent transcriptional regulator [Planctomycetes bacterium]|nr:sigma-54 dependent transcriptional regulator [Planctomycetota bacterium]